MSSSRRFHDGGDKQVRKGTTGGNIGMSMNMDTDDEGNNDGGDDYTDSIFHAASATGRYDHDDDDSDDDDKMMDDTGPTIDVHDDDIDIGFRDTSTSRNNKKGKKRTRQERQDEALYGVFYDRPKNNIYDHDHQMPGLGAPMFVAASKPSSSSSTKEGTDDISNSSSMFVKASSQSKNESDGGEISSMFVKATKTKATETEPKSSNNNTTKKEGTSENEDEEENENEAEETRKIQEEQKAADEYFLSLIQKAKETNRKSRTTSSKPPSTSGSNLSTFNQNNTTSSVSGGGFGGLGLGGNSDNINSSNRSPQGEQGMDRMASMGIPTSFGAPQFHRSNFSQHQQEQQPKQPPQKKDPSLAKWEKHTKGIGSKLLSKMGWKGSGGLGSNRRSHQPLQVDQPGDSLSKATQQQTKPSTSDTNAESTTAATTAATTSTAKTDNATTLKPKKGISRPVEVVVRPANMGLGFGNFKEASQLKSNRQIEAEVRGIELEDDDKNKKKKVRNRNRNDYGDDFDDGEEETDGWGSSAMSSAIPSADDVLAQQSWKRRKAGGGKGKNKNKKQAVEIVTYEEMLKRQQEKTGGFGTSQPVIIDMRGPTTTPQKSSDPSNATSPLEVPLGEELLYNLSFLLNTYENKLYSVSTFQKSTERKLESIKTAISELEEQKKTNISRLGKLQTALQTIEDIREIIAGAGSKPTTFAQKQVEKAVSMLASKFSARDKQELQFWSVLAPTLLSPIMKASLDKWNPFDNSTAGVKRSHEIIDSFFLWTLSADDDDRSMSEEDSGDSMDLRMSLILNLLIPKLKSSYDSPRWDPIMHSEAALELYEYLNAKAIEFDVKATPSKTSPRNENVNDSNQVFPSNDDDDDAFDANIQSASNLSRDIKAELVYHIIHPKLQTAISNWKPSYDSTTGSINNRLDLWVLPWIPHLDHPGLLPNLMSDCRRKLKTAISYLNRRIVYRTVEDDRQFLKTCLDMLSPWERVFDEKTVQRLVGGSMDGSSTEVLSRLVRLVSKHFRSGELVDYDWTGFQLLVSFHARKFVSDIDFLSVVEADLVTNWAIHIFDQLSSQPSDNENVKNVAKSYCLWKSRIFVDPFGDMKTDGKNSRFEQSMTLVRNDSYLCRMFYSVLRMVQLYRNEKTVTIDELDKLEPSPTTYTTVAARRAKEAKLDVEEEFVRMEHGSSSAGAREARMRLLRRRRGVDQISFREVVEETARAKGIMFQPRTGSNAWHDGRQVFNFGGINIYLEDDVVFHLNDGSWSPVSLDQLLTMTGHG